MSVDSCPADADSPPNPKASTAVWQLAAVNLTMPAMVLPAIRDGAHLQRPSGRLLARSPQAGRSLAGIPSELLIQTQRAKVGTRAQRGVLTGRGGARTMAAGKEAGTPW